MAFVGFTFSTDDIGGNLDFLKKNYITAGCDNFINYSVNDIDELFDENPFLDKECIFKTKLWLPYLLLKTLDNLQYDDIVMYSDNNINHNNSLVKNICNFDILSDSDFTVRDIPYQITNNVECSTNYLIKY